MGALRAIALAAVLSLTSCGAMRFLFAHDDESQPSRVERVAQVIAANGSDPVKWISWLAGVGAVVTAGAGYAGGRWHGKERRSGRDRRRAAALAPGVDSP